MCIICDCNGNFSVLQGVNTINIMFCQKITEIPNIKGVEKLYCNWCPNLKKIPVIEGLRELKFSGTLITEIPNIPGLITLECTQCENITKIPEIKSLRFLDCSYCKNLKIIPRSLKLCKLSCRSCRLITEIPDIFDPPNYISSMFILNCSECPWLKNYKIAYAIDFMINTNVGYYENISKLLKLQAFCRKYFKYSVIKRYMKSRQFAEWFYDPNNFGGYKHKQRLEKNISVHVS